jgi:hypothetical protein
VITGIQINGGCHHEGAAAVKLHSCGEPLERLFKLECLKEI